MRDLPLANPLYAYCLTSGIAKGRIARVKLTAEGHAHVDIAARRRHRC